MEDSHRQKLSGLVAHIVVKYKLEINQMNMFKPVRATNIKDYIAQVPDDRRKTVEFVHNFIQKTAPTLTPHFASLGLGYGEFEYVNYKKQTVKWPVIGLINQKNYISIYICSLIKGEYVAEKYKNELGKVSVGRSCIRFKKIDDINLDGLRKVIQLAAKHPGLVKPS